MKEIRGKRKAHRRKERGGNQDEEKKSKRMLIKKLPASYSDRDSVGHAVHERGIMVQFLVVVYSLPLNIHIRGLARLHI